MKRKNVILGAAGIVATATLFVLSPWKSIDSEGTYTQESLSSLQEKSADDARLWLEARYTVYETGERISEEQMRQIDAAVKALPKYKAASFIEQGPDNIGGRTRAIQVDKTNSDIIWAGGVSGGLFKSENRANSWEQVATYEDLNAPFISSMAQLSNGTLFVATGSNNEGWGGNGVWYTTDQGTTWTVVPGTANLGRVTEVAAPDNGTTLWLTSTQGLKKWNFGDASLTDVNVGSGSCGALKCSADGMIFVVAMSSNRTYVSTNGGVDWEDRSGTSASGKVPQGAPRIEYAISQGVNSAGMYSLYAVRTGSNLQGMNVSHDSGATWTQFVGASGTPSNLDIYRNQGTYNTVVSVTPQNAEKILIGGIDIWKWQQTTTSPTPPAGGFEKLTEWFLSPTSNKYAHADNHEMQWDGDRLYLGNDGGIGVTDNPEISWYPANRGYNVTQFYGIAFDRHGSVMGGAQDNGSLYNDHTLSTWKEFREVSGGDGFQCEISFYNPSILFSTVQYGSVLRSGDGGVSGGSFTPDTIPSGYTPFGQEGGVHPFHTRIFLAEHYDTNSEDSVTFIPDANIPAGTDVKVPSLATGDTISYTTTEALYFDDTMNYTPALSVQETSVVNQLTGQTVNIDLYNWVHLGTSGSGGNPPAVADSLLVDFPGGTDTVVVESVGSYTHYYAQHPVTGNTFDMGIDSVLYNVAWNTARVQDPFQSWFLVYTAANGGELWGTRNALRLAATDPQWGVVARNIGTGAIDIEFSKDLNHCFISSGGSTVRRLDSLGSIYTSSPTFEDDAYYITINGNPPVVTPPQGTTMNSISAGIGVEGIAVNPSNSDDIVVVSIGGNIRRSANATSASPTFTTIGAITAPSPAVYDAVIDRDDPNIIVAATSHGVFVTENGGGDWMDASEGFTGTPVYEVRQSWRTWDEGNFRPGEIYAGTFGRGIWSSASYLSVDGDNGDNGIGSGAGKFMTNLSVFPNPTVNTSTLRFDLQYTSDVNVAVYNLSGRLVKSIVKENMSSGTQFIELGADELARGTYIVKFQAGDQRETAKFIKR